MTKRDLDLFDVLEDCLEEFKWCLFIAGERCAGLEGMLFDDFDLQDHESSSSDAKSLALATRNALAWYYYTHNADEDTLVDCMSDEFEEREKEIVDRRFGSLSNYAHFIYSEFAWR